MERRSWAEDHGSWTCTPGAMDRDSALMLPWIPSGEAAAEALQYSCYHPAAIVPPWAPSFDELTEDRTTSASRSHSEAEKRRRDRINAQLATLRKLVPKSEKMDKAALLGHVVNHVKEESKRAKEVSKISTIPTEVDEVIIDYLKEEEQDSTLKASICCEDRPEFFSELNSALKGIGVTVLEADVTSLGGRMRTNIIVCGKEHTSCSAPLKQSLKLALSRIVISSGSSSYSARSKRQRFFYPHLR